MAVADCLVEMLDSAPFLHSQELENTSSLFFRALKGELWDGTRKSVARLLWPPRTRRGGG